MNRIRDGNVIQFPPKLRDQSLERKLEIRRQSAAMTQWIDRMLEVDRMVASGAQSCGMSERAFRPYMEAELRKRGRL
jgi:hypothetical protein